MTRMCFMHSELTECSPLADTPMFYYDRDVLNGTRKIDRGDQFRYADSSPRQGGVERY